MKHTKPILGISLAMIIIIILSLLIYYPTLNTVYDGAKKYAQKATMMMKIEQTEIKIDYTYYGTEKNVRDRTKYYEEHEKTIEAVMFVLIKNIYYDTGMENIYHVEEYVTMVINPLLKKYFNAKYPITLDSIQIDQIIVSEKIFPERNLEI